MKPNRLGKPPSFKMHSLYCPTKKEEKKFRTRFKLGRRWLDIGEAHQSGRNTIKQEFKKNMSNMANDELYKVGYDIGYDLGYEHGYSAGLDTISYDTVFDIIKRYEEVKNQPNDDGSYPGIAQCAEIIHQLIDS